MLFFQAFAQFLNKVLTISSKVHFTTEVKVVSTTITAHTTELYYLFERSHFFPDFNLPLFLFGIISLLIKNLAAKLFNLFSIK